MAKKIICIIHLLVQPKPKPEPTPKRGGFTTVLVGASVSGADGGAYDIVVLGFWQRTHCLLPGRVLLLGLAVIHGIKSGSALF